MVIRMRRSRFNMVKEYFTIFNLPKNNGTPLLRQGTMTSRELRGGLMQEISLNSYGLILRIDFVIHKYSENNRGDYDCSLNTKMFKINFSSLQPAPEAI